MAKSKMNPKFCECPFCGIHDGYKTHKNSECSRCGGKIDKDGLPIFPDHNKGEI